MRGMTTQLTLGERIAWYRQRRGLTQEVIAGRVGRTVDWLSKIENGRMDLDRLSVLSALAEALDVSLADLIDEPRLMEWTEGSGQQTVPALRSVLMDYRHVTGMNIGVERDREPMSLDGLKDSLDDLWDGYQQAKFGYVVSRLVDFIPEARYSVSAQAGDARHTAAGRLALAYQLAATVLTKLGEADLAWNASNRGIESAHQSENPVVIGSLMRSVAHSLLSTGSYAEAVSLTNHAAEFLEPHLVKPGATLLSVYGTGLLAGSMAAARNDDRSTARDFLDEAERTAARLGRDANYLWTAFGPTNVGMHRVSTAMELGDVQQALNLGPALDTSGATTERRVRHALEVARALSTANRREEALAEVLRAEQLAPEQVRYHFLSRHLVQTWVRTQKGKPSHQLKGLADRLRVA